MNTVADIILTFIAHILLFVMQHIPYRMGYAIARGLVGVMRLVNRRLDRVAMKNLSIAFPEKSEAWRTKVMEQSYDCFARNVALG